MSRRAIGWDIHRKFSQVSVRELRDDGELCVVDRRRLDHENRPAMKAFLAKQPPGTPVAIEAAFGWPWVADLLEEFGLDPRLAHPPAVRVLAKHQAKTDRCDSDRLAEFQLLGLLPESYLAPPELRQLRERTRYRMAMTRIRSGLKNRVQAILHRQGLLHNYSDLFGAKGREFLDGLHLPEGTQLALRGYLTLLDSVYDRLAELETWMTQHLKTDEDVQLLTTIPGIGTILAHVIQAEVGELSRFPSPRHFVSYCGLAPVSDDSAGRHGRRRLSPACNHTLRWALIEAANTASRPTVKDAWPLQFLRQRLERRGRTKGQAKTAVAHQLALLVYVVLTKRKPYTTTPPARPGAQVGAARAAARRAVANNNNNNKGALPRNT